MKQVIHAFNERQCPFIGPTLFVTFPKQKVRNRIKTNTINMIGFTPKGNRRKEKTT